MGSDDAGGAPEAAAAEREARSGLGLNMRTSHEAGVWAVRASLVDGW